LRTEKHPWQVTGERGHTYSEAKTARMLGRGGGVALRSKIAGVEYLREDTLFLASNKAEPTHLKLGSEGLTEGGVKVSPRREGGEELGSSQLWLRESTTGVARDFMMDVCLKKKKDSH